MRTTLSSGGRKQVGRGPAAVRGVGVRGHLDRGLPVLCLPLCRMGVVGVALAGRGIWHVISHDALSRVVDAHHHQS